MMEDTWTAVDDYFGHQLISEEPIFKEILQENSRAGLPAYDVSPNQGKLLQLFVQMISAKSILEIGTLGAYSTIWMAKALPKNGHIISLEFDSKHAEVAKNNISRAGLDDKIEVRIGNALDLLPQIKREELLFDLVFIDADKKSNPDYFKWALNLSLPGSVIIVDNIAGLKNARAKGKIIGRVRKRNDMLIQSLLMAGLSFREVAKIAKCSHGSDRMAFDPPKRNLRTSVSSIPVNKA